MLDSGDGKMWGKSHLRIGNSRVSDTLRPDTYLKSCGVWGINGANVDHSAMEYVLVGPAGGTRDFFRAAVLVGVDICANMFASVCGFSAEDFSGANVFLGADDLVGASGFASANIGVDGFFGGTKGLGAADEE